MAKRIVALLLLVFMLVPMFAACGGDVTTTSGTETSAQSDAATGDDMFVKDSIPDEIDYGGLTINVMAWDEAVMPEFDVESATGENVVEDAIYYRNQEVEMRLGVDLNFVHTSGEEKDLIPELEQLANANLSEYDIISAYSRTVGKMTLSGLVVDLFEFDVLDFSAPWWSKNLIETSTVNGMLLYASGDVSPNLIYMMNCTFFNTTMLEDLGLENPYDLVRQDNWNVDKMFEMCEGLYQDLDENGYKSRYDNYGLAIYHHNLDAIYYGAGLTIIENKDGNPQFSENFFGDHTRDYIVKMIEEFQEGNDCYYENDGDVRDVFGANRSLFIVDSPMWVPTRGDNFPDCFYGIVPVPKWYPEQDSYYTCQRFNYSLYTLFAGSPYLNEAATVLECLASENYRKVTPAVFEITMKYQYSLDDVAAQMFDIIRENIIFDFAREFSTALPNTCNSIMQDKIARSDKDWATFIRRSENIMKGGLARIVENLNKLYGKQ